MGWLRRKPVSRWEKFGEAVTKGTETVGEVLIIIGGNKAKAIGTLLKAAGRIGK